MSRDAERARGLPGYNPWSAHSVPDSRSLVAPLRARVTTTFRGNLRDRARAPGATLGVVVAIFAFKFSCRHSCSPSPGSHGLTSVQPVARAAAALLTSSAPLDKKIGLPLPRRRLLVFRPTARTASGVGLCGSTRWTSCAFSRCRYWRRLLRARAPSPSAGAAGWLAARTSRAGGIVGAFAGVSGSRGAVQRSGLRRARVPVVGSSSRLVERPLALCPAPHALPERRGVIALTLWSRGSAGRAGSQPALALVLDRCLSRLDRCRRCRIPQLRGEGPCGGRRL